MGPWEWRLPCYHKYPTLAGTVGVSPFGLHLHTTELCPQWNNGCDIILQIPDANRLRLHQSVVSGEKAERPPKKQSFPKLLNTFSLLLIFCFPKHCPGKSQRNNCWPSLVPYSHRTRSLCSSTMSSFCSRLWGLLPVCQLLCWWTHTDEVTSGTLLSSNCLANKIPRLWNTVPQMQHHALSQVGQTHWAFRPILPWRYISSPSVNIWLHRLHRAQLGW